MEQSKDIPAGAAEHGVAELEHRETGMYTKGQPGLQGPSPREVKKAPTWGRWWQPPDISCQSIKGVMRVYTQEDGPVQFQESGPIGAGVQEG